MGWNAGRVSLRVMSVIEARVSIASECSEVSRNSTIS